MAKPSKFEYLVVAVNPRDKQVTEAALNALGLAGWELVAVVDADDGTGVAVLKRLL